MRTYDVTLFVDDKPWSVARGVEAATVVEAEASVLLGVRMVFKKNVKVEAVGVRPRRKAKAPGEGKDLA